MLTVYQPKRVYFEKRALEYPRGQKIYGYFSRQKIPISIIGSHNRVRGIPGTTPSEAFREGKNTWVFGVRRTTDFQTCKPSAHYQLPLYTGCPGMCQYCYLHTNLGKKPYLRAYVNVEEILAAAEQYIMARKPAETVFEGAATSDPLPLEPLVGSLKEAIEFFGAITASRFRFVTKFANVEPLLGLKHRQRTRIRFSLNTREIIRRFESRTAPLEERLSAAAKVAAAGYPTGFLIAPLFLAEGWQQRYRELFRELKKNLEKEPPDLTFEFVTHRFTARGKKSVLAVFPERSWTWKRNEGAFVLGSLAMGNISTPRML